MNEEHPERNRPRRPPSALAASERPQYPHGSLRPGKTDLDLGAIPRKNTDHFLYNLQQFKRESVMKDFAGKIVFVTGGASGAGLGQAKVFGRAA
jgi:hypothetical protein